MNLPRLEREPIRPEREQPDFDKEIWQPHWRCFCCQDTGTVSLVLTRLVIPDYDHHRDKQVVCQHPRCEAGKSLRGDLNYDQRFTAGICDSLDRINREDWRKTVEAKFQSLQKINADIKKIANGMRMPETRDRTPIEEIEAQQRHEEVCSADPEKLKAVAQTYLGSEYMKDGTS